MLRKDILVTAPAYHEARFVVVVDIAGHDTLVYNDPMEFIKLAPDVTRVVCQLPIDI